MTNAVIRWSGVLLCWAAAGCAQTRLSWIKYETCAPARTPAQVIVHFTRKSIQREYRTVARYQVRASGQTLYEVMRKVTALAAKHGCDAVLIEQGTGYSSTVWSWVLLFIPVTEHGTILEVSGIRYVTPGGDT